MSAEIYLLCFCLHCVDVQRLFNLSSTDGRLCCFQPMSWEIAPYWITWWINNLVLLLWNHWDRLLEVGLLDQRGTKYKALFDITKFPALHQTCTVQKFRKIPISSGWKSLLSQTYHEIYCQNYGVLPISWFICTVLVCTTCIMRKLSIFHVELLLSETPCSYPSPSFLLAGYFFSLLIFRYCVRNISSLR